MSIYKCENRDVSRIYKIYYSIRIMVKILAYIKVSYY